MLKRCWACGGQKKVMGMGMIEKKCDACKGVGMIEEELQEKRLFGAAAAAKAKKEKKEVAE